VRLLSGDLKAKTGDFSGAAAEFLIVVNFIDDRDLKPLALWKLINALEKKGDSSEAVKYRAQLLRDFPKWEPPK
jgi:TolA-binding protein